MNTGRFYHACQEGDFDGKMGIFVSGGFQTEALDSVEFYVASDNKWIYLGNMQTPRYLHSVSLVNGNLTAAGGYGGITSIEKIDETGWRITGALEDGRERHAAVSLPVDFIHC